MPNLELPLFFLSETIYNYFVPSDIGKSNWLYQTYFHSLFKKLFFGRCSNMEQITYHLSAVSYFRTGNNFIMSQISAFREKSKIPIFKSNFVIYECSRHYYKMTMWPFIGHIETWPEIINLHLIVSLLLVVLYHTTDGTQTYFLRYTIVIKTNFENVQALRILSMMN